MKVQSTEDGVTVFTVSDWSEIASVINSNFLDRPHYIWRGQQMEKWTLEPTLTRLIKGRSDKRIIVKKHLTEFQRAILGRRGSNPKELSKEELWAIGQHNGLATPLLDWTASPYVALFFAFAKRDTIEENANRVLFALNEKSIREKCSDIFSDDSLSTDSFMGFIRPSSDENSRLINQAGLFSITASELDLESFVKQTFKGLAKAILAKILIPNKDRAECLKGLNKMNINYMTLFPDVYGASQHTNLKLEIDNY